MKRLLNLFAIGLLLAACDMEQQEPQVKVQSTYSVECASYDFTDESGVLTKSVIGVDKSGSDGSQKVSNWNIWVYDHSTGSIVNNGGKNIYDETMMTFFRQTSGIDGDLLFPDENGHYDIYILTNVEQITSVPATASAAAAYNYTFDNYNSFKPENGGFPMATVYSNFCPATAASHTFLVKRLVSKYDVVIVNDIPDSEFILSSVKLMQGAKKINPFQENSKIFSKTEAGERFDYFSVSELENNELETGQSLTGELYMLENNQGQVFKSSVSTDKERIPDNMINPQNGELCTFVEFAGDIKMKDGHGQNNITFRHYFGSGRNAGVMRNINTTVTLTLKTCPNDSDENWRIVPEDPYDTRTVVFNPNPVNIVANGSWYDVTVTPKGGDPLVLNDYIEYRLECPDASSASLSFDGVTMGSTVNGQKTLRIKSNYSGSTPKTVKLFALSGFDEDLKTLGELECKVSSSSRKLQKIEFADGPDYASAHVVNHIQLRYCECFYFYVFATYSDGSVENVTSKCSYENYDFCSMLSQNCVCAYAEGDDSDSFEVDATFTDNGVTKYAYLYGDVIGDCEPWLEVTPEEFEWTGGNGTLKIHCPPGRSLMITSDDNWFTFGDYPSTTQQPTTVVPFTCPYNLNTYTLNYKIYAVGKSINVPLHGKDHTVFDIVPVRYDVTALCEISNYQCSQIHCGYIPSYYPYTGNAAWICSLNELYEYHKFNYFYVFSLPPVVYNIDIPEDITITDDAGNVCVIPAHGALSHSDSYPQHGIQCLVEWNHNAGFLSNIIGPNESDYIQFYQMLPYRYTSNPASKTATAESGGTKTPLIVSVHPSKIEGYMNDKDGNPLGRITINLYTGNE